MSRAPAVIPASTARGSERSVGIRWHADGDHPEVMAFINIRRLPDGTPVISIPREAGRKGIRVVLHDRMLDPPVDDEWNPNDLVSARRDAGKPDPTAAELAADYQKFNRR